MTQIDSFSNGIKVFGSALVRVTPDIMEIEIAISRIEKKPKDAFSKAHNDSKAVYDYLKSLSIQDVQSSRISLSKETEYKNGEHKFIGYKARIVYSIMLRKLSLSEEVLIGVIEAGANELISVSFQTSRLKELRKDARIRAIQAAKTKAEIYASAAGISVGEVQFIEDVNPNSLSNRYEGHVMVEPEIDDAGEIKAVDPGSITVGAAVNVLYAIAE